MVARSELAHHELLFLSTSKLKPIMPGGRFRPNVKHASLEQTRPNAKLLPFKNALVSKFHENVTVRAMTMALDHSLTH